MIHMFFFFQAEDGIRDIGVTGVQTCALPISARQRRGVHAFALRRKAVARRARDRARARWEARERAYGWGGAGFVECGAWRVGGGRAVCRGRVLISGGAVSFKKKSQGYIDTTV